jgi:hypothetical protein
MCTIAAGTHGLGLVVDNNYTDEALTVDFAVRALAREAQITMEELAAAESAAVTALRELEPEFEQLSSSQIIKEKSDDLSRLVHALSHSTDSAQRQLYENSAAKIGAGRQYGGLILTVAASATVIICALRLRVIEIGKDGKGISIRFNDTGEPLSQSARSIVDLVRTLFGRPASSPGSIAGDKP